MKLSRGQKLCKNCNKINAARQRTCKHCHFEFNQKNIPVKNEILNWKELEIGTYIKVIQGSGPYFISNKDSDESKAGDRICLGSTGVFKVINIGKDGLVVFGATPKNSGFDFLYMGETRKSNITGACIERYKIKRVKRRIVE